MPNQSQSELNETNRKLPLVIDPEKDPVRCQMVGSEHDKNCKSSATLLQHTTTPSYVQNKVRFNESVRMKYLEGVKIRQKSGKNPSNLFYYVLFKRTLCVWERRKNQSGTDTTCHTCIALHCRTAYSSETTNAYPGKKIHSAFS